MKINWKLRFKNKATLIALLTCSISFVYQVLGIIGITTPITEDMLMQYISAGLNLLVALGVLVDPTTKGISDSVNAVTYQEPK
ncbi:phage holin [Anaerovorax odorimutans]|uniref:phage holin n=1 Tax=Anaerovorax odorimutans TaxID=109327 RepID=UPI00041A5A36|nr:phage holin [Anaerovorax odorimutans]